MSGLLPSRGMRWLLLVLACLAAISLFLLATASANTALADGWHHVAGVLGKDKKMALYVDGALAGEAAAAKLIPKNPNIGLTLAVPAVTRRQICNSSE